MRNHTITIGERDTWGGTDPVRLSRLDRRQHAYIIGKTGTGKSTLLRNMIVQDIAAGEGVGLIDPHGDLAIEVLDAIPPWRSRDVLYFNPSDAAFPIGFNPLHGAVGDARHLVASAIVSALKSVWRDSWGPRLEYILYACVVAVASTENGTILGVQRMLTDDGFRQSVIAQIDDPIVRSFWEREFASYDRKFLSEAVAPIQNKIGQLIMSPLIRNILGQVRGRVEPRLMMDSGKIFIANLGKGKLGEDKSNLLGSLLVSSFQTAAMSRSELAEENRRDWFLYVDEFQNFATDSFASILSEARKQRLCLTLAHQYTSQLRHEVRDAVFGNAGTIIALRTSEADSEILAREFGGGYSPSTFATTANHHAHVKLLAQGAYGDPFLARLDGPIEAPYGRRKQIINRARSSHATPRSVVEERIARWIGSSRFE